MSETALVTNEEVKSFIRRLMTAAGSRDFEAVGLGDVLCDADYRGHFSHGMNRLAMYFKDVKSGSTACEGEPTIIKEKGATAWVNGNNLLGSTVSKYCMNLAIKKAKEVGIGSSNFAVCT